MRDLPTLFGFREHIANDPILAPVRSGHEDDAKKLTAVNVATLLVRNERANNVSIWCLGAVERAKVVDEDFEGRVAPGDVTISSCAQVGTIKHVTTETTAHCVAWYYWTKLM